MEKYSTAGQATDDNTIRRMRIVCCIPKTTDTHGEYVIFIAFPRQRWLHERVLVLCLDVPNLACSELKLQTHTENM